MKLNEEKIKNNKLTEEINNKQNIINQLLNELNSEKQKNFKLNNQIQNYINMNNQLSNKINSLQLDLNSKVMEIQNLKNKINYSNSPSSNINYILPGEKILAINFISTDHKVNFALACKNTDAFVKLEQQLYDEYPQYKEVNTYFTVGGNIIKRFKSLQENKIKNHDSILLNIYE